MSQNAHSTGRAAAPGASGITSGGSPGGAGSTLAAGSMVLVTLANPREKFWGALLELGAAGVSVRGLELSCFDDFAAQVVAGEPATLNAVFFPMHRVERVELDAPAGELPSLRQQFEERTGRALGELMDGESADDETIGVGLSLVEAQRRLLRAMLRAVEGDVARAAALLEIDEEDLRRWTGR